MTDEFKAPSALDYLREELSRRRAREARRVKIRDTMARPDLAFTCRVPSDSAEYASIVKQAEAQESKKGVDVPGGTLLACMTLARFTEQVTLNGRDLAPGDGAAFAWPELQEALGVTSAWAAVRALVDDDFAIVRLWDRLTDEMGLGGKAVVEDDSDPI